MVADELKKEFGKRFEMLVHLLDQKGYASTKTAVGNLMGVSTSGVSQMIAGERIMTAGQMHLLRKATNFNSNWFLTGHGSFFLEENEEKEDSLIVVAKAMNSKRLTIEEGEQIITDLTHARKQVSERDAEIIELTNEIIALQRGINSI